MRTGKKLTRRTILGGLAGAAGLASPIARAQARSRDSRPNIVFFLADDLGFADVGCYGRPDLKTPHIDRLAQRGLRFTQAYANSAVCSATRTALITGRYQYRLPIGLEEPLAGRADVGLPSQHPTLPSLLKKAGYRTMLVGKWHLGQLPSFGPLQSGYEHFYGFRGGSLDYYSHKGSNGEADLWDDDIPVEQTGYMTRLLGERAVQAVNEYSAHDAPFLLSVHFNAPHWPWEALGDEAESMRVAGTSLRDFDGGTLQTYRRMIEEMDTQIGGVLQAIEGQRQSNRTIVVFTSDNGGERFSDTWPFSGKKTELLEGGLRIPSIIAWPDRIAAGSVTNQASMSMDWMPTLLAAAGTAPHPDYPPDGMNLMPVLTRIAAERTRQLFWRFKANHQRAVRDGDYKYLKILQNTYLFNVVEDPLERANLKERDKKIYEKLQSEWLTWNDSMLPEIEDSYTESITAEHQADHIGSLPTTLKPDAAQ